MKHRIIHTILAVMLMTLMFTANSATATVPNGGGVQKYNPGVGWNDFAFIKGEFTHAIFDWGNVYIKTGSWLSLIYGVTTGAIDPSTPVEDSLADLREFFEVTIFSYIFNGEDITQGLIDAVHWDEYYEFYWEEDGVEYKEVFVRAAYYIIPQAMGCYDYYASAVFDDGFLLEKSNVFCWLPPAIL